MSELRFLSIFKIYIYISVKQNHDQIVWQAPVVYRLTIRSLEIFLILKSKFLPSLPNW